MPCVAALFVIYHISKKRSEGANMKTLQRLMHNIRHHYQLYLMVLPGFLVILIFNYIPMYGVQIAFRKYSFSTGFSGGEWVGLQYLRKFFSSYQFWSLIKNTLAVSLTTIVFSFPVPIILAIIFSKIRSKRRQKLMQTLVYLPHFISVVVLVSIMTLILSPSSGILGQVLGRFGYNGVIMGDSKLFVPLYVITDIWQHAGWNSIIYIAALSAIDYALYESAYLDGASTWQIIRYIDLPSLVPTMMVLLTLTMGSVLGVGFEKVYLMQNSLNLNASEIISTYVYKIGLQSNQYSYSAAISLFNNVINFFFVFMMNQASKRMTGTSIW